MLPSYCVNSVGTWSVKVWLLHILENFETANRSLHAQTFMLASVLDLLITHPDKTQFIFFTILKKGTTSSSGNYKACTYIVHSSNPASVMSLILQRTVVIICRIITYVNIKNKTFNFWIILIKTIFISTNNTNQLVT